MSIIGILLIGLVLLLWVGVFGCVVFGSLRERGRRRVFGVAGGLLIVIGVLSFFAPMAAKWLPSDVEWPVGWAGEVITLPSGMHVVSHNDSNRVQVYDSHWKFIRGWWVDCAGGVFVKTAALPDSSIEIVTARTHMRYVFDIQGNALEKGRAPPQASAGFSHITLGEFVPTWPWLFTLTTPFVAFLAVMLGIGVLVAGGHIRRNGSGG